MAVHKGPQRPAPCGAWRWGTLQGGGVGRGRRGRGVQGDEKEQAEAGGAAGCRRELTQPHRAPPPRIPASAAAFTASSAALAPLALAGRHGRLWGQAEGRVKQGRGVGGRTQRARLARLVSPRGDPHPHPHPQPSRAPHLLSKRQHLFMQRRQVALRCGGWRGSRSGHPGLLPPAVALQPLLHLRSPCLRPFHPSPPPFASASAGVSAATGPLRLPAPAPPPPPRHRPAGQRPPLSPVLPPPAAVRSWLCLLLLAPAVRLLPCCAAVARCRHVPVPQASSSSRILWAWRPRQ